MASYYWWTTNQKLRLLLHILQGELGQKPPGIQTSALHDEQGLPRVQLDVDALQHPCDVKVDLEMVW